MLQRLMVVTDTFAWERTPIGPTLELAPRLIGVAEDDRTPADWWPDYPRLAGPHPTQVELRRPDGAIETITCRFVSAHLNYIDRRSDRPPGFKPPLMLACHLPGARAEQAPPGTEIWYEDSLTPPHLVREETGR